MCRAVLSEVLTHFEPPLKPPSGLFPEKITVTRLYKPLVSWSNLCHLKSLWRIDTHIKDSIVADLNHYCLPGNDNAISVALNTAFYHLDKYGTSLLTPALHLSHPWQAGGQPQCSNPTAYASGYWFFFPSLKLLKDAYWTLLCTFDSCKPIHNSNSIVKLADDNDDNETAYEVQKLCAKSDLKHQKHHGDYFMFQDEKARHTLVYIKTKAMERDRSFNVIAATITEDFSQAGSCE